MAVDRDVAAQRGPRRRRGDAYRWRQLATAASFAAFGATALAFGFVVAPALRLRHRDPVARGRATRAALRRAMRAMVATMRGLGVLEWRCEGTPPASGPALVVSNHPSLIDAVLLLAVLDDAHCVVKGELEHNPFVARAIDGLAYPANTDAARMVDDCTALLAGGARLLMFPEATRTPPDRRIGPLHRGAAYVAVRAGCPVYPVTIRVSEPTLAKGAPWWNVPVRRPRFVVRFHPPWPPAAPAEVADGARARALNRRWEAFFVEELGCVDPP